MSEEELIKKIDEVLETYAIHLKEYHGALAAGEGALLIGEHKIMFDGFGPMQKDVSRILRVIEGIPDYNARNEVIGYIGGMRKDITDLKDQANGGGGYPIRIKDKAQLVGFMTIVIVALERASQYL